jgi:hypothetical protein
LLNPPTGGKVGGSLTEINSNTGALVRTVSGSDFGFDEFSVPVATSSSVIVTNLTPNGHTGSSITLVSAKTGGLIRVIRQPQADLTTSFDPATNGNDFWIVSENVGPSTGQITEFNASTGAFVREIQNGLACPEGIGAYGRYVWASDHCSHTVTEFNAMTGSVIRQVPEPKFFDAHEITSNGTDVWVLSDEEQAVMEFPISN